MTTLFKTTETCRICGQSHEYVGIGSTNEFGSPDLDTRPPEMRRSTILYWVRRCPSCGYCAPQVSEGPEEAKEIVASEEYRRQLDDRAYPELANRFLCWALIQERVGSYARAGWAALHAAWACDDQGASEAARRCRLRALELFRQSQAQGKPFIEGRGAEQVLLADLLRRSGCFEQVAAVCQEGLRANPTQLVREVLAFQEVLARLKDDRAHRIEEAIQGHQPRKFSASSSKRGT